MLNVFKQSDIFKNCFAKCRSAECHYAECRGAVFAPSSSFDNSFSFFFHFFSPKNFEQKVEGQRHRVSIEGRGRAHCVACGATTDSLMTFVEMTSV